MILNADEAIKIGMMCIGEKRTMVFDLDNTLYPESSFLKQAYDSFARDVAKGDTQFRDLLLGFIYSRINRGKRSTLLQDICHKFSLPFDDTRDSLFYCLRQKTLVEPLEVYPWVDTLLRVIDDFNNVAIITNGNPTQQRLKISNLLPLRQIPASNIILANELRPKPATDAAIKLAKTVNISNPIYFGDSPVDEQFAKSAGWHFFLVRVNVNISAT
jgi:FMN phosphatase YigB (HAD superfamily)